MKIAVSAAGKDISAAIDPRFGRARYFVLVDSDSGAVTNVIDNSAGMNAAQGAGIQAAASVAQAGAGAVLTGHVGPKAFAVLQAAGIKIISNMSGTVEDAVNRFKTGNLSSDTGPSSDAHQGLAQGPPGTGRGMGGPGRRAGGQGMGMCRNQGGQGMGGPGSGRGGSRNQ